MGAKSHWGSLGSQLLVKCHLEQDANTRIARKPINGHEFLRLLEVLQSCAQAPLPIARPGYTRPVPSPELSSVELSTRTRSASVV